MQIAERLLNRPLIRACEVTRALCALPAVATLDWCDRAAACLCRASEPSTAVFLVCELDSQGRIGNREAVGVSATPGTTAAPASAEPGAEDPMLTGLRSRAHRLPTLGITTGSADRSIVGLMDRLAPDWRVGPVGRLWSGQCRGELIVAAAPLQGEPGRAVVAYVAPSVSGTEAAAVIEATFPLLAQRAAECLSGSSGGARNWLTLREQEVLEQLTLGKSVKEIAESLGRSPHTVHDHVKSLHRKLSASTRGELVARALGHLPARRLPVETKPIVNCAEAPATLTRAG
jgi:DNA-binding CsgD family transcriptional regulator